MASTLVSALGNLIFPEIKRQFIYLCCFDSNAQNLDKIAKKLKVARDGLNNRVDRAKDNAEVILPDVETWLKDANQILEENNGIQNEIGNIQNGCLSIIPRFSLSKKVVQTAERMEGLWGSREFQNISTDSPPPAARLPTDLPGSTRKFESRKRGEEDIMKTLRENKVNMVGICGMGGVGKTTMAKIIRKRVMEEKLYKETVMVVVGQPVQKLKIQGDMADQLRLKLDGESLLARACRLRDRLNGEGRKLIILDDVWESLNLGELGIPCESDFNKCSVLLTSRDKDVFNAMGVKSVCEMGILLEPEAWSLFKENFEEKASTSCVADQNLLSIASEIAKKCNGLPVALVNVAIAVGLAVGLEDKKNKSTLEDALRQLQSSNPIDLPHILAEVYNPIKLSYDFLENEHAKSIFLLCCLFPEDYDIPFEDLALYAMGLHIFERSTSNLEHARNRTWSLIGMLKRRSLLLEGDSENHVKMHDVVRDVSIFIASKEKRIGCNECTWISSFLGERSDLFVGSIFPNLHLLLIDGQINDDKFFEGMKELKVLSMRSGSLTSLPRTTQSLKNLRTLLLLSCYSLETISTLGELKDLEILICRDCFRIKELPLELGRLNCLRRLEILGCPYLRKIAPGVISSLKELEELKIVRSFKEWEAGDKEGTERKNAGLRELESLSNLTQLEIEVKDFTLAAEQIRLSTKIKKFNIAIGSEYEDDSESEKQMELFLPEEITIGSWVLEFLRSVETLRVEGEGLSNLELAETLQSVRSLILGRRSTVKKLVNITTSSVDEYGTSIVFPLLESLGLWKLDKIEEICDIGQSCSRHRVKFPKLKKLSLGELPNLTTFGEGIESFEFPLLIDMVIRDCPNLKSFISGNNHNNDHSDDASFHLFCNPKKVAFGNLKKLRISGYEDTSILWCHQIPLDFFIQLEELHIRDCGYIRSLFSSSITRNLVNLKTLTIKWCMKMKKVIEDDEEEEVCPSAICLFPRLQELHLESLPKLGMFCNWGCACELPSLNYVFILNCPKMKRFSSESITAPNLISEKIMFH